MDRSLMFVLLAAWGLFLVVTGIMAYRRKYVAWMALKRFVPGWPGLAQTYLGLWLMLFPVLGWIMGLPDGLGRSFAGLLVFALWALCLLVGVVGFFWLPRFMLPQWLKEDIEEVKRGEDPLSQALKPGGSLYGRLGVPRDQWPENRPGSRGPADRP